MSTIRIKKGVKPYGGRRMIVHERYLGSDGSLEYLGLWLPGQCPLGGCIRVYRADEVEDEKP